MSKEAAIRRQELRRSNAAVPHRNRYREFKSGKDKRGSIAEGVADARESKEKGRDW
ncbi:hypothetical protein JOEDIRT_98 [Mycobacterium phage JoeDirt]|uniref:Uncharacterized protein n=1 Tax=Mycobacterium phage JoeDirt TaxID=2920882 RepID=G1BQM7_9CAUD|nr:hypothetical protein FGG55_gp098 [Mycobacterium phage JoeDirt]AEK07171.1 hypothetical protein JOEDIRT_98 [Mycobacterium phage JoeDirt]